MSAQHSYSIELKINGETHTFSGDSLEELILNTEPEMVLTEAYITARKGDVVMERKLNLNQARDLYRNPGYREIFINNLLLN